MSEDVGSFLRWSLRAHRDPEARTAMRAWAARAAPDWNAVGRLAYRARVAPLLHRAWRDEPFVPARLQSTLRQAYLQTGWRNLVVLRELAIAVAALEAAGVPSIVLKGAALLESVYRNIALRPLADVDLLVRREHLERALTVLTGCGFATGRPELRRGAAGAYENQLPLFKQGRASLPLELHWSLFDSPFYQQGLDLDWCWQAARPLPGGPSAARMLDPVAQLLHLCGHLVLHHGGVDLLWEHDIAEFVVLYGEEVDWSALLDRAVASNLVIPVKSLLPRIAVEDAVPIPPAVLERLQRLQPSRDEQRIAAKLTAPQPGVARRFWIDVASMTGWHTRVGYAWTHLFPSAAYMRARYQVRHRLLLPLYYPYRWLRGLRG